MSANKVAIIGTGLIGRGWAAAFARAGWQVSLWDGAQGAADTALAYVRTTLADMQEAGLVADAVRAGALVSAVATLEEALAGASFAQENVPERADVKRDVFLKLDALAAPGTILASSTSTLGGSLFLADVPGRDRCIVAHPSNPPHLMPVVEVAPSPWHGEDIVRRTCEVLRSIGQVPVIVNHEIEGFVLNRLQTAVVNEAVSLVARGVIAPADLDAVMKHGLGLRWALMGPFETMDMNAPSGFLDYATRFGHLYQQMGRDLHVADPWPQDALRSIEESRRAEIPRDRVGERMRWRDRALMQLHVMKQDLAKDGQA
ncbi:MAG: 3-hydroxyacyl-CoA dehydrogenase [Rhizobiaceae bacterium]